MSPRYSGNSLKLADDTVIYCFMTDSTGKCPALGSFSGYCCWELPHGDLGKVAGFH